MRMFIRHGLAASVVLALPALALAQASQSALRFFGTGIDQQDRVRIQIDDNTPGLDASAPCDVGQASFTIEFWVRGSTIDNATSSAGGDAEFFNNSWIDGNIIIDRDIWGRSERDWGISFAGGFVRFGTGRDDNLIDPDNTIEGSANVLDGNWHHVALTRDANTGIKRIYVDASLDFQSSPFASLADISYPDSGAPNQVTQWGPYIVIGAEKHDADPVSYPSFSGFIDELRVWTVARSASDIASDFNRVIDADAPGLVAYYRFEESTGTTVLDSSAASSPAGQLIAGVPGNGQWMLASQDPLNTAPLVPLCPGDIAPLGGDASVDIDDLTAIVLNWNTSDPAADIDNDGVVEIDDLTAVILSWGRCP